MALYGLKTGHFPAPGALLGPALLYPHQGLPKKLATIKEPAQSGLLAAACPFVTRVHSRFPVVL